ncbi:phage major capsid protein [Actinophytocola sp. NPDC049390]|uniref:phage major capsid protein n=1 Tax=Actinophytocola sp. NPDC049390 TaxID=3363894 RepID=UPI0037A5E3E2
MAFKKLDDVQSAITEKSKTLHAVFDEAGPEMDLDKVKTLSGDSRAKAAEIRKMNDELTDLGKQRDDLLAVQKAADAAREQKGQDGPGEREDRRPDRDREYKSFGQRFIESAQYKAWTPNSGELKTTHIDVELKTLFQRTDGWSPEVLRSGRVVPIATTPIDVLDLFPVVTTSQSANKYMQETVYTNNAAELAEAGLYPESAFKVVEVTDPIQKIGNSLPITDEQLEDESQAKSYVEGRLLFGLRQRLNTQVLVGNGTSPNLRGLLNVVGIQTQAKGTDPVPDAVYKAMVKVMTGTGQAVPNAYVTNPLDWQEVRLLRTADGIYIWGSPSEAGPDRIWGLQVALAQGLTENTGVVGDFANFAELVARRGVELKTTDSHADDFLNGKQRIRADVRVGVTFYRPTAFATVTGI